MCITISLVRILRELFGPTLLHNNTLIIQTSLLIYQTRKIL